MDERAVTGDPGEASAGHVFAADEPLPLTGERTTPGVPEENYWFQRHVRAYRFAAQRVAGLITLDAGSGEGYGCDILAARAARVVGIDLEEAIVRRAAARYPRCTFECADLAAMPFAEGHFDAVVSLQVIEHLPHPVDFLAECARVLRPGGTLVLSTPNRITFSPDGIRNPFHTFEFSPDELRAAVGRAFADPVVAGVFHGPRLTIAERLMRRPLPERLIAQPAFEWPGWLRATVAATRPEDFRIRGSRLERSLDLVVVARRP